MSNTTDFFNYDFKQRWAQCAPVSIDAYANQECHFLAHLLPEQALQLPARSVLFFLERRYGAAFYQALQLGNTMPSPVSHEPNGAWLRYTNMVGINVRTIGNFWNIIKYVLTLPQSQDSIHLLPIWECGVIDSLYGMAGWNINPEFFSYELAATLPHLDDVEKQLKVVVNLLHLMGKTVGMDVIPHTDRYSEVVLSNPNYFEWLQRKDAKIVDHSANLHKKVQEKIMEWLKKEETKISYPKEADVFFSSSFPEDQRNLILFGEKIHLGARNRRRNQIIQHLYDVGYESVPATMAPPYRDLVVSSSVDSQVTDEDGRVWRDYLIRHPKKMSRVFGPLTRYKFYEAKDDNINWEIDFSRPRTEVWDYVRQKYFDVWMLYNFDFMRGDMSHIQMRPDGVPPQADVYYDVHKTIKQHIRAAAPYFGYFAESFIAPAGEMAYGDEADHLEMSDADSTLGNLQSIVVGTSEFIQNLRYYHDLLTSRSFAPNFTIITADKDDPRFDIFYIKGNELRLFLALFLTDMPSYMSLGFECRDAHLSPAPNEHYTKLYVFHLTEGPKATTGPYQWGQNTFLFYQLSRIRTESDRILPTIKNKPIQWLLAPDATGEKKIIAWTQKDQPTYIFVANLDIDAAAENIKIPIKAKIAEQTYCIFSTHIEDIAQEALIFNGKSYHLNRLEAGEGRILG